MVSEGTDLYRALMEEPLLPRATIRPDLYQALAEGWWLIESPDVTGKTFYSPLEGKPALFQHFAHMEATREEIGLFANEHGPLGAHRRPVSGPAGIKERMGEPFDVWEKEIRRMRYAVDVWEAVRGNDWKRLGKWIDLKFEKGRFQSARFRRFEADRTHGHLPEKDRPPSPGEERLIVDKDQPRARDVPPAHPENLQRVSLFYVQAAINRRLAAHSTGLQLLFDPKAGTWVQRAVPANLLGAMWSQFSQVVAGSKRRHRECAVCGEWFEMQRSDARQCSDRCRMKNYRNRQAEAYRRARAGIPYDEIAADLGTTVETVSGWINAAKGKRKQQQEKKGR